jgi:hypothetical protein
MDSKTQNSIEFPLFERVAQFLCDPAKFNMYASLIAPADDRAKATYFANLIMCKNIDIIYAALLRTVRGRLVLKKLRLSLTKDTPTVTSSVSGGTAKTFYEKTPNATKMIFINCGTGKPKLQPYEKKADGSLVATENFEYAGEEVFSLNQVIIPGVDYGVKKTVPAEVVSAGLAFMLKAYGKTLRDARTAELLKKFDKNLPNHLDPSERREIIQSSLNNFTAELDALARLEGVPIVGFMTGTARNFWEKADESTRQLMSGVIGSVFLNPILQSQYNIQPWLEGNFLMSQRDEALNEFSALGTLVASIDPSCSVVWSDGAGRGTCQRVVKTGPKSEDIRVIEFDKAMDNWPDMIGYNQLTRETFNDYTFYDGFLTACESAAHPTVAFKSGFLITLSPKVAKGTKPADLPSGAKARNLLLTA